MNKKVLIALPLALMLTVGLTACGSKTPSGDKEPEKVVEYVDKDYVDVTAIGGTIKGKEYSHDKIEKNKNVTIVAPRPPSLGPADSNDFTVFRLRRSSHTALRSFPVPIP